MVVWVGLLPSIWMVSYWLTQKHERNYRVTNNVTIGDFYVGEGC